MRCVSNFLFYSQLRLAFSLFSSRSHVEPLSHTRTHTHPLSHVEPLSHTWTHTHPLYLSFYFLASRVFLPPSSFTFYCPPPTLSRTHTHTSHHVIFRPRLAFFPTLQAAVKVELDVSRRLSARALRARRTAAEDARVRELRLYRARP